MILKRMKTGLKKGYMRIVLRSYDVRALDKVAKDLVESIKRFRLDVSGPIPLPKKIRKWTFLSGPHIDKKARHQLQRIVRSRVVGLPASNEIINMLESSCSIPGSVDIEVKT